MIPYTKNVILASADQVAAYLRDNPDYFQHRPELLELLRLPDSKGEAVSLLERQASILRDRNNELRDRLNGLLDVARDYANCPVRLGSPSRTLGLPQELENASFATGVGLLLWGVRNRSASSGNGDGQVAISTAVMQRVREWLFRFSFKLP